MGIAESLAQVRARMDAAAARAGRDPAEVTLVAVSKGFGAEAVANAAQAGLTVFGENRVQEAAAKIPALSPSLQWHMLGHVQSNKARQAVALFDCVQAVDSLRLARALARHAAAQDRQLPVLLQVNVSGKPGQFGLPPADALAVAQSIAETATKSTTATKTTCPPLRIDGLMTIASFTGDEATLRAEFQTLRRLRDELRAGVPGHPCRELSMGMTNDYEIAIEEGATIVRVGRALFGERPPPQPRAEAPEESKKVLQSTEVKAQNALWK